MINFAFKTTYSVSVIVKQLSKWYGTQKAVDNISFEASKGEILGFLGPNGAGKSTTMKIICGFVEPSEGDVWVGGQSILTTPLACKRKIGFLPENNPLYLDMYVREYLEFSGRVYGMKHPMLRSRINEVLDQTGLLPESHKLIGQLSKGYKQRTGLAQALLHEPEVLILDEPTTGLDPNQVVEIRQLIREVAKNKTVIFSSHIMQEVELLCDRIIILDKGVIRTDSEKSNLLQQGRKQIVQTMLLEFKEDVLLNKLLPKVAGVHSIENIEGQKKFRITFDADKDIRPQLFALISSEGWNLLEMKMEEMSMEQVFREFTT